jgi:NAD(P)-dependent dehydrogenase (short-subunit alcohol dehydrogenase family)
MVWRVSSAGVLDGKVAIVTGTSRGVGVGIAHELLRVGATVIGCFRSKLDGIPGADADGAWLQRSAQMVCDQGDFRAIDAMVSEVADTWGESTSWSTTRVGRCPLRTSKTSPNWCNGSRALLAPKTTSSGRRCFMPSPFR